MDTGPMLLQRRVRHRARRHDRIALEPRLAALGAELLLKTLDGLASGTVRPVAQDEGAATMAPLIRKSEGLVDFGETAGTIHNRLRGFSPWPGAQFTHEGRILKIIEAPAGRGGNRSRAGDDPGPLS
jgi:methionyl-tRNA formyltransferase